jgi:dTDP-4-dehydrorhamnose 3,5-epimerase
MRPTELSGVVVIEPSVFRDARGFFRETYHSQKYRGGGIGGPFVQDNHSRSCRSTLRGLHYQLKQPQGKLVYVVTGEIFDVAVDIRRHSATFGQWTGVHLSARNHRQVYIPEGFAHGFAVLSDRADVIYKCTALYAPGDDHGILWNDPDIGIEWPVAAPILSEKDRRLPRLHHVPPQRLPQ